jgi:general secretion pathway protein F
MAVFTYRALGKSGMTSGELNAADRPEALRQLDKRGLQPVNLSEVVSAEPAKAAKGIAKHGHEAAAGKEAKAKEAKVEEAVASGPIKLKRAEVVLFTEELSDMLSAGMQLEPALRAMENREELGSLKAVSFKLRQDVREGTNFSTALKRASPSFGPLYCSLAAAGEASGALDSILKRQAHYLKMLAELQGRIALALIYPAILVVAGVGVSVVFVTKLIPQLTSLMANTPGSVMPLGARMLIGASDFMQKWWLVIALVLAAGLVILKAWKDNDENKPVWDKFLVGMPLVGPVVLSRFYVQFLETMANLVANGLPLLRALELSHDATQNLYVRSQLKRMIDLVGDGRAFSRALVRVEIFPPLLIDMISVGEQTGKLDQSLRRAAERYDRELNKNLQKIMALIMPCVLIVMAVLIGTMAYLMITAIFQTISNLGG